MQLLLVPLVLALAPVSTAPKILILDVKAAAVVDAGEAPLVTQALARAFAELHPGQVVAVDDVRSLLDAKAQNELLGCADPRCAKDLGAPTATNSQSVAEPSSSALVGIIKRNNALEGYSCYRQQEKESSATSHGCSAGKKRLGSNQRA